MELSERLKQRQGTTTTALSRAISLRGEIGSRIHHRPKKLHQRPHQLIKAIESLAGTRLAAGLDLFALLADQLEVVRGAIFLPSIGIDSRFRCFAARGTVNHTISPEELPLLDKSVHFLTPEESARLFFDQPGRGIAVPFFEQEQPIGLFIIHEAPLLQSHKEVLFLTLEAIVPPATKLLQRERQFPASPPTLLENRTSVPENYSMEISLAPFRDRIFQRAPDTVIDSLETELSAVVRHLFHPMYQTDILPNGRVRAQWCHREKSDHELHRIHVSTVLSRLYCMEMEKDEHLLKRACHT